MKTCDYCERENPDDAVRCLECGTSEFKSSRRDELQAGATPVAVSSAPPEKSLALRGGLTGRWMVGPGPARDAKDRAESRFDKWNWFRGPAHIVAPRVSGGAGAWVYNSDSRGGQATLRFKDNEVTLKAGAGGLKLLLVAMMIPLGLGGIAILKDSENYPEHRWIPVLMLALAAVFFFLLLRKGRRWSFTQDCIANACLVYFPRRRAWGIQFVAGAIVVNRGSTASDPLSSASLTVVTLQLGKREVAEALLNRLPTRRMEVLDVDQQERIHFQNELKAAVARAWVTPALIAANGIILGWMWVTSIGPVDWGYLALTWGANFGPLTLTGEPWRLLTSCFVHFGVAHLGLNMWALWSTGRTVERLQGNGRFLVIYLASGLAASMASLCWNPFVISAGASGAVMGVYGSLAGYLARERRGIPSVVLHGVLSGLAAFVINNLLFAFSVRGIDHAAHIGGLVTGAILGFAAARPVELKARARASRKSAAALAAATVAVTVLLAFRLPSAGNLLAREEGAAVFDAFSRIGVSRTDLQAVSATNPAAAHHLLAAGIRMRPEDVVLMQTVRSNRANLQIRRMQALQASEAALDFGDLPGVAPYRERAQKALNAMTALQQAGWVDAPADWFRGQLKAGATRPGAADDLLELLSLTLASSPSAPEASALSERTITCVRDFTRLIETRATVTNRFGGVSSLELATKDMVEYRRLLHEFEDLGGRIAGYLSPDGARMFAMFRALRIIVVKSRELARATQEALVETSTALNLVPGMTAHDFDVRHTRADVACAVLISNAEIHRATPAWRREQWRMEGLDGDWAETMASSTSAEAAADQRLADAMDDYARRARGILATLGTSWGQWNVDGVDRRLRFSNLQKGEAFQTEVDEFRRSDAALAKCFTERAQLAASAGGRGK